MQCIIVGAGICGLIAGQHLQQNGMTVQILEQAPIVGGRMATLQIDGAVFDAGAQYFTARTPEFKKLAHQWEEMGLIRPWFQKIHVGHAEPCYIGAHGMAQLPQALANTLTVETQTPVQTIQRVHQQWQVISKAGKSYLADAVLLTAPVPQSLTLVKNSAISLEANLQAQLETLYYDPCLVLLVTLNSPSGIPAPGGRLTGVGPLGWIADNTMKGISQGPSAVTLQADAHFSREWLEADDAQIAERMLEAATPWLDTQQVLHWELKRWVNSIARTAYPHPFAVLATEPLLLMAGDSFANPRIEGAAMSGLAAAQAILAQHTQPTITP